MLWNAATEWLVFVNDITLNKILQNNSLTMLLPLMMMMMMMMMQLHTPEPGSTGAI